MKRPSFQFYPGDFFRDPGVRALSFAARGLWTDMLCLMHESDRRGYLQLNGKPVNAEQLARMTGGSTDEVSRLLQELENSGVFSRSEHGVAYSRRMVRDERKRDLCSEAGKRGGGNPTFKGHPKGVPKGRDKGEAKASSSSSTSTSVSDADASQRDVATTAIQVVVDAWNMLGKPFAMVSRIAGKRRTAIRNRLADDWWRENWRAGMERVRGSTFCRGGGEQGWVADFDWFVRPDTLTKVLEGKYDARTGTSKSGGSSDATRVRSERTDGDFSNIPVVQGVGGQPP